MRVCTTNEVQDAESDWPASLLELTHELEERLRISSLRMAIAGEDVTAEIVEVLAKLRALLIDKPH